ncbi:hypothetical protein COOONC_27274 [Cooperia oncophora]
MDDPHHKKRYDNMKSSRAKVIKRLVSLPPAKGYPKSCETPGFQAKTGHFTRENTAKIMSCTLCGRTNYKTYESRTVKEAQVRRKVVMEKNLCWKCFSADHKSSDCKGPHCKGPHCKRCNRLHDEALSLQKGNASSSEKGQGKVQWFKPPCRYLRKVQKSGTNAPPIQPHLGDSSTIALHEQIAADKSRCTATNEQIVLMAADRLVWNHSSNQYERALFIFDTGAQVSLILEKSAEHVALPVSKTEHYSLSGVSGMKETFLSHNAALKVQTTQGRELEFFVKTKPKITAGFPAVYLTGRDILYMERHTSHEYSHERRTPVFGLDLYDHFVNESSPLTQLSAGLKFVRTIFGLAAYGRG